MLHLERVSTCAMHLAILAATYFAAVGQTLATPPEGYYSFAETSHAITFEGVPTRVVYKPAARLEMFDGKSTALLWIEADLADIQKTMPKVLSRRYADEECGDRVRVTDVSIRPQGDVANLGGIVHYERWECVKTHVPEFRGLEVKMTLKTVAKSLIVEQAAEICIELSTAPTPDGKGAEARIQITCVEPSRGSLLGKVQGVLNIETTLRRLIQGELEKVIGSRLTLALPPELSPFDPRISSVRFVDRGDGILGIIAEGRVTITSELVKLLFRI